MFLPIVTEQLRRLVSRPTRRPTGVTLAPRPEIPEVLPPKPATDVPPGTRYQLFRALQAMAAGQAMLVQCRIPAEPDHFENAGKRDALFQSLRTPAGWEGGKNIEPLLVPGTSYPRVIGRILIQAGWCAPCSRPHWVPNLRFFFLTDRGRESFARAQAWWADLTAMERLQLMLFE